MRKGTKHENVLRSPPFSYDMKKAANPGHIKHWKWESLENTTAKLIYIIFYCYLTLFSCCCCALWQCFAWWRLWLKCWYSCFCRWASVTPPSPPSEFLLSVFSFYYKISKKGSSWKNKNCPWTVLEFWFDKAVRTLKPYICWTLCY